MSVRPRHVACILGKWKSLDEVERIIKDIGGKGFALDEEYSIEAADPRMKRAFEASRDRVSPSFEESDEKAIAQHRAVAYVLSPNFEAKDGQAISVKMLAIIAAILESGGTAAKGESSGIAHGRTRWMELAKRVKDTDPLERASALLDAFLRRPLGDDDREVFYSCGMHLLGERDIELPSSMDPHDAIFWIDALAIYLAAEKPEDDLRDGETFRPTDEHAKRVLRARECERYEEDDFFFNPYGYWNLAELK